MTECRRSKILDGRYTVAAARSINLRLITEITTQRSPHHTKFKYRGPFVT